MSKRRFPNKSMQNTECEYILARIWSEKVQLFFSPNSLDYILNTSIEIKKKQQPGAATYDQIAQDLVGLIKSQSQSPDFNPKEMLKWNLKKTVHKQITANFNRSRFLCNNAKNC